jgi:hypothetical protein
MAVCRIKIEKEVSHMSEKRKLCRVYVVDPKGEGKVIKEELAIVPESADDSKAILKSLAGMEIKNLDSFDIYVEDIATFIRGKKEVQRILITKNAGDEDSE